MPEIWMIRHGKAAADWSSHSDPGLAEEGHEQARSLAESLKAHPRTPILVSPMQRTRQTALPLCSQWQVKPVVTPAVSEIPSPPDIDNRTAWLKQVMESSWSASSDALRQWRSELLQCLLTQTQDTLIFSHFVAINLAVGVATQDDRCLIFRPGYCSISRFRLTDGRLALLETGFEAQSRIH